jgi:hypothetical protein
MREAVERVTTAGEAVMRHIMVVNDDPHIGLAIRAWLKRYGFKVAAADGSAGGLAAIDNSTFDLMIVEWPCAGSTQESPAREDLAKGFPAVALQILMAPRCCGEQIRGHALASGFRNVRFEGRPCPVFWL